MTDDKQPKTTSVSPKLIEEVMKGSYLDYAMSVIVGRALPDVRDGLKPVHRRILYAMHRAGLSSSKAFRKSAFVVGRVIAEFHPHGDSAVYDALVRMAQHFSMRYPLVWGQGNFGSVDGDPPAAMRYTESKLKPYAEELLEDINKETVTHQENFDGSSKEPLVLPSKAPNLLLNGSTGIAVGMATNIPPHNLSELCTALISLLDNPEISLPELMEHLPAPDFPTGGIICGKNGIINAYATGRGKLTIRAKTSTEEIKGRKAIIVYELPYMVNKAELIAHIADLARDKRVEDIHDLRDESDKQGMRMVIELKQSANEEVVLNQLFVHSRMQTRFSIIMLSLVDNEPKILPLKQMLYYFLEHRKEIITRRTAFDLRKAEERAHIVEGILIALKNIDDVVKLIKAAKATEEAKSSLVATYTLSDKQAQAILEMRLQRLTSLEQTKLRDEHENLLKLISNLKSILASEQKIKDIIKQELMFLMETYGDSRRTEISELEMTELDLEQLIQEGHMVVTVTHSGYIKRLPLETYRAQRRGGKGITATTTKEEDSVASVFVAHTHSYILFFTNRGRVHWLKAYHVPEGSRQARGKAIVNLLELEPGETISAYVPVKDFEPNTYIVFCTANGIIKKTALTSFSRPRKGGIMAVELKYGDSLVNATITNGTNDIVIATQNGLAARFKETDVRSMGRQAAGVRGIRLAQGDKVVSMQVVKESQDLFTITENGFGKRTPVEQYRRINRGGKGVINIIGSPRNGKVVRVRAVTGDEDIMVITQNGIVVRTKLSDVSTIGRNTQGVRIMRLGDGDKVVDCAIVADVEE